MDSREAWEKFIETGRVDYYLLSRGIDVYGEGYVRRPQTEDSIAERPAGGEEDASDGFGDRAEGQPIG
ncbi:MAG: hypothetical protein IJM51_08135 [Clostridia bacterium]|nr:hypothetical protein [Clostridia bacterium]